MIASGTRATIEIFAIDPPADTPEPPTVPPNNVPYWTPTTGKCWPPICPVVTGTTFLAIKKALNEPTVIKR
jgi:hypothetical protein